MGFQSVTPLSTVETHGFSIHYTAFNCSVTNIANLSDGLLSASGGGGACKHAYQIVEQKYDVLCYRVLIWKYAI